jgi:hypothetical protein
MLLGSGSSLKAGYDHTKDRREKRCRYAQRNPQVNSEDFT